MSLGSFCDRQYEKLRVSMTAFKYRRANRLSLASEKKGKLHILANGPSLGNTLKYVDTIGGEVMMLNGTAASVGSALEPNYYVFACRELFDKVLLRSETSIYSSFYDAIMKMNSKFILFAPNWADVSVWQKENIDTRFVNSAWCDSEYVDMTKYYKKNTLVPCFRNVTIMALYVAIQLGYQEIYIHGLDMDYIRNLEFDEEYRLCSTDSHLGVKSVTAPIGKLVDYLNAFKGVLFSFEQLRTYADKLGVKVYNMNPYSMIDSFTKYLDKKM